MKKKLSTALLFLFWLLSVYGIISFYELEINFKKWSDSARFCFIIYGYISGTVVSFIHYKNKD